jgi:hypothetical protein
MHDLEGYTRKQKALTEAVRMAEERGDTELVRTLDEIKIDIHRAMVVGTVDDLMSRRSA